MLSSRTQSGAHSLLCVVCKLQEMVECLSDSRHAEMREVSLTRTASSLIRDCAEISLSEKHSACSCEAVEWTSGLCSTKRRVRRPETCVQAGFTGVKELEI